MKTNQRGADGKTDSHWDTGIAKTMTPMPNDRGNKSIKYHTNRPLNLILAHTLQLSVILLGTTDNINKSALTDIYIYHTTRLHCPAA